MAKNNDKSKWDGFSLKPRKEMPAGLWLACPSCQHMLFKKTVAKNLNVCPECNHHFRIDGPTRIMQLVDEGSFEEMCADISTNDPLAFKYNGTTYKGFRWFPPLVGHL